MMKTILLASALALTPLAASAADLCADPQCRTHVRQYRDFRSEQFVQPRLRVAPRYVAPSYGYAVEPAYPTYVQPTIVAPTVDLAPVISAPLGVVDAAVAVPGAVLGGFGINLGFGGGHGHFGHGHR
jgi:hypothetical protein